MLILLLLAAVVAVLVGPQLWARHTLRRHDTPRSDFPGTGGELARHLLERLQVREIAVETADAGGDHYDPLARCVRLTPGVMQGRSLTAIVVAAHEVGHALQHRAGYRPLLARTRLAQLAGRAEWLGSALLVALPFAMAVLRVPVAGIALLGAGLSVLLLPVLVHLVTLPVELDASFRRALPLLASGYLQPADLPAARRILTACALTYVAGALMALVNVWRWIRVLRRA